MSKKAKRFADEGRTALENALTSVKGQFKPGPGPLESYKMAGHCEMCGASDFKKQGSVVAGHVGLAGLEPAFDPSGKPKTLCRDCRIGSAELLGDVRADMLKVLESVAARWDKDDDQDAPELGAAIRNAIKKAKGR
jgi:hypothetical protein